MLTCGLWIYKSWGQPWQLQGCWRKQMLILSILGLALFFKTWKYSCVFHPFLTFTNKDNYRTFSGKTMIFLSAFLIPWLLMTWQRIEQGTAMVLASYQIRKIAGCACAGNAGNFPGIPGVCATGNFTYLVRGPLAHIFGNIAKELMHHRCFSSTDFPRNDVEINLFPFSW